MNAAAIHLALNHFSPILDFAALIVLVVGVSWKSAVTVRTGLILLILAALIAIPVYLSGEEAEHVVEGLEGVNSVSIHPHEEAAEWAAIILCTQGVIALAVLLMFLRRDIPQWAIILTLLVTVVATIAVFRAAYMGGKIHHPETQMAK